MRRPLPGLLLFAALACGRNQLAPVPGDDGGIDGGDAGAPDAGTPDAGLPDAGTPDAGTPDAGPEWQTARVALHFHSANSHDACDGSSDNGPPFDQNCVAQMKAAVCASRLDAVLLTDHPRFMDSQTFEADLLYDPAAGETLVAGPANRLACGTMLAVGYEGTHTMPLGLRRHLFDHDLYRVHTDFQTSIGEQRRLLAEVHAAGGIYFVAHSEEPDMPASLLQALETDGMEWYNVHGNILQLYKGDRIGEGVDIGAVRNLIDSLKGLEPFLYGSQGANRPHPDLAYLVLLEAGFPRSGLEKWHDVLGARFVAGGLGNDVHQNVSVNPVCKAATAEAACRAVAAAYPNVLSALIAGGPLLLNDGERIDSYGRITRWLHNRALVREKTMPEIVAAMGSGRSYGIWAVFGEPGPFAFWAESGTTRVEMGGRAPAAGATLRARLPDAPRPELGANWTAQDAARAGLRALLWRTTGGGKELIGTFTTFGAGVSVAAPGPGKYSLEISLVPRHLEVPLGKASALAGSEYRWIISNAVVLE